MKSVIIRWHGDNTQEFIHDIPEIVDGIYYDYANWDGELSTLNYLETNSKSSVWIEDEGDWWRTQIEQRCDDYNEFLKGVDEDYESLSESFNQIYLDRLLDTPYTGDGWNDLNTRFTGGEGCYKLVETITAAGTLETKNGSKFAIMLGLWEYDNDPNQRYHGYFATTGLLPNYCDTIYPSLDILLDQYTDYTISFPSE